VFPLAVKDVKKFEKLNEDIAVSVLTFDERQPIPLYVTPHRNRKYVVHLLLLSDKNTHHYVLVKNLSRLVHGRTKHINASFVCPFCFHCFAYESALSNHIEYCSVHCPQTTVYPQSEDAQLFYNAVQKEFSVPYILYIDFETFQTPSTDEKCIAEHVPSGFSCVKVSRIDDEKFEPYTYSGPNVLTEFYKHIYDEQDIICKKLSINQPMLSMTEAEKTEYDSATTCQNCRKSFDPNVRIKAKHHCHTTGRFLGAVCSVCNLQLKYRKKRSRCDDWNDKFFLPVVAHNMKGYDSHLILKGYEQHASQNCKITVIPSNTEKFVAFQIGQLRFLDSLQFLSASLDSLVNTLPPEAFKLTTKFNPCPNLAKTKGIFPYEYLSDISKFDETSLPAKELFYSALTETGITDDEYERAQTAWTAFGCKNLRDYHDAYLLTDTLLLADVFEHFRSLCLQNYGLDPAHFYTTPGLSFQACLKMTDAKLQLFSEPEMHLLVENGIRGGVSVITSRYAKANNRYVNENFDADAETASFICYLDANNLYGYSMSQPLPMSDFRFLSQDEIRNLDILSIADDAPVGFFLEVDLIYPRELHHEHNDMPLAPEKLVVTKDMLSEYAKSFPTEHIVTSKLIPNLNDKHKYVTHYVNLKLYMRLGMKLTRIHRVLEFKQSPWMKPYIDFNTEKRQQAKTEFEKRFLQTVEQLSFR